MRINIVIYVLLIILSSAFCLAQAQSNNSSEIQDEGLIGILALVGVIGIIMVFIFGFIIIFSILGTVFWIFMLIDIAKRQFKNENDKIVWILVVALAGVLGAIIYYFFVKAKDKKKH